jgi:hypothetical protein
VLDEAQLQLDLALQCGAVKSPPSPRLPTEK